jgi:hypothetical protein
MSFVRVERLPDVSVSPTVKTEFTVGASRLPLLAARRLPRPGIGRAFYFWPCRKPFRCLRGGLFHVLTRDPGQPGCLPPLRPPQDPFTQNKLTLIAVALLAALLAAVFTLQTLISPP